MSNTGQLPETWTVENLTSPHTSKPFNPDIANTFFRAGKIESWGQGIEKMLKACEDEGLPKPTYEDEGIGLTLKFLTHLPPQLNETPAPAKSSGKIVFLMQEPATISIPGIAANSAAPPTSAQQCTSYRTRGTSGLLPQ